MTVVVNPVESNVPLPRGTERTAVLDELKDIVTRDDFRMLLDEARAAVADPAQGYFGAESVMWKLVKPLPVVPLMLWYAGMLEVFEPRITAGFSTARMAEGGMPTAKIRQDTDALPRYSRSYDAFMDWFLGDDTAATRTAQRIFGYHSRIVTRMPADVGGSRYTAGTAFSALEPHLLVFTVLTQVVPLRQIYEHFYGPLTFSESLQYHDEALRFGAMLGADPALMPANWDEMQKWLDDFYRDADNVWVDEDFLEALLAIFGSRFLAVVIMQWNCSTFPPALAERVLALPQMRKYRRVARGIDPAMKLLFRAMPDAIMVSSRWRDAMERVGRKGWTRPARVATRMIPRPFGAGDRNFSDTSLSASKRMKATIDADRFLDESDQLLAAAEAGGCPMSPGIGKRS